MPPLKYWKPTRTPLGERTTSRPRGGWVVRATAETALPCGAVCEVEDGGTPDNAHLLLNYGFALPVEAGFADDAEAAVAKEIYARIFKELFVQCNKSLQGKLSASALQKGHQFIGQYQHVLEHDRCRTACIFVWRPSYCDAWQMMQALRPHTVTHPL